MKRRWQRPVAERISGSRSRLQPLIAYQRSGAWAFYFLAQSQGGLALPTVIMHVENMRDDEATIIFSIEELEMLCHAISEALAGVPERGFKTRTTVTPETAEDVHAGLDEMLQDARADRAAEVIVSVTGRDLAFFCSAFNEALNGIRRVSPGSGTGANRDLAKATHQRLREIWGDVCRD